MTSTLMYFLLTVIMFVSLVLLQCRSLRFMVILASVFSILSAMLFTVMQAPDVALTEAVVGGGMMTVIFLGTATGIRALFRYDVGTSTSGKMTLGSESQLWIEQEEQKFHGIQNWRTITRNWATLIMLVLLACLLLVLMVYKLPKMGGMHLDGTHHFAVDYIQQTLQKTNFHNVVNAIVVSQRGFDTLMELCVILVAGLAIMLLLNTSNMTGRLGITKNKIIYHTISLLMPIMLIFTCYLFTRGEYAPGGGFQSGVLIAIVISVYTLIHGIKHFTNLYSLNTILITLVSGVFLYLGPGLLPVVMGVGTFSENSSLPVFLSEISGIFSEMGIMAVVFSTMILMFRSLVVHFHQ